METNIAILYFSGYGQTKKQAEAVEQGAKSAAGTKVNSLAIDKDGLTATNFTCTHETSLSKGSGQL